MSRTLPMKKIAQFVTVSSMLISWAGLLAVADVDTSTLRGKIMCGYQGWFNCEGDGADLAWTHWARGRRGLPAPGNIGVDLWPDMREYGPGERFATGFKNPDGSPAEVFSSYKRETVMRHFGWMRDDLCGDVR